MTDIDRVVLDFDGTCTLVHEIEDAYLSAYFASLRADLLPMLTEDAWTEQLARLRAASPQAGWMLGGAAPAAPASADPYMLAGEAATRLAARLAPGRVVSSAFHHHAYDVAQARFRPELASVLAELVSRGLAVTFVSNSSSAKIVNRLDDLLAAQPALRARIQVESDAAKFSIREIALEAAVPAPLREAFGALPAGALEPAIGRPIYLRRGRYFEALCKVWNGDPDAIAKTLVCGDVWELDLAMPLALGCQVHLIARRGAHPTYDYERAHAEARGALSDDLHGLLVRLQSGGGSVPHVR